MRKLIILLILIYSIANIYSVEEYLGSTPQIMIEKLGAPDQCYTERGEIAEEDDVVFFYKNSVYLYFNNSRVWQLRADNGYTDAIHGVEIGYTKEKILDILGEPVTIVHEPEESKENQTDSIIYRLTDRGFQIYLRLYFENNKLDDIYIFRGDY